MKSSQSALTPSITYDLPTPMCSSRMITGLATVTSLQWWLQFQPCTYASASDRAVVCVASIQLYPVLVALDCMVSGEVRARAVLGTTVEDE